MRKLQYAQLCGAQMTNAQIQCAQIKMRKFNVRKRASLDFTSEIYYYFYNLEIIVKLLSEFF